MRVNVVVALAVALGGTVGLGSTKPTVLASVHQQRPVPRGFSAGSVSFISPDEGWVLGSIRCRRRAPCAALIHTTDGGGSWHRLAAPPVTPNSAGRHSVNQLRFVNRRVGFAADPALWRTHDGGRSWRRIRSAAGIHRPFVYDLETTRHRAYAVLSHRAKSGGPRGDLRLAVARPGGKFRPARDLGKRAFAGLETAGRNGVASTGHRMWTIRPDRTIRHRRLPESPCRAGGSAVRYLVAVCGFSVAAGGMGERRVYGSSDAGRTWVRLHNPGAGRGYAGNDFDVTRNGHVAIATFSAGAAAIRVTTDYAESWHNARTFRDTGGLGIANVAFSGNLAGVFVFAPWSRPNRYTRRDGYPSHGRLYRTTDGGVTWPRVALQ